MMLGNNELLAASSLPLMRASHLQCEYEVKLLFLDLETAHSQGGKGLGRVLCGRTQ